MEVIIIYLEWIVPNWVSKFHPSWCSERVSIIRRWRLYSIYSTFFPVVKAVLAVSGQWDGNNVLPSFMISSSPVLQFSRLHTGPGRGATVPALSLSLNNLCYNSVAFLTLPLTSKKKKSKYKIFLSVNICVDYCVTG